jgi:hypothetical protein
MVLFATACQKELSDNNITRYPDHPLNDTVWIKNVPSTAAVHALAELLSPAIVVDSFDTNKDTTITYGDSLDIRFTAGSCQGTGGVTVTGKAKLEIFWLKKRGDYIKAFKSTSSNDSIMNGRIVFFVRITKDGKELTLKPGTSIRLRMIDPFGSSHGRLDLFYGRETNPTPVSGIDTGFTWKKFDNASGMLKPYMKPGFGIGWEFNINQLRWNGLLEDIDSLKDHSTTRISGYFSPNFTNKNTVVFAVYTNLNVIVNLKADINSRTFSAANFLPHGRIKLLSISKIGEDFYLSTKDIIDPGLNKGLVFKLTPEKKSLNEIKQFLDSL